MLCLLDGTAHRNFVEYLPVYARMQRGLDLKAGMPTKTMGEYNEAFFNVYCSAAHFLRCE